MRTREAGASGGSDGPIALPATHRGSVVRSMRTRPLAWPASGDLVFLKLSKLLNQENALGVPYALICAPAVLTQYGSVQTDLGCCSMQYPSLPDPSQPAGGLCFSVDRNVVMLIPADCCLSWHMHGQSKPV
jgi:hypothetical protein